jgi:hypothetical protein
MAPCGATETFIRFAGVCFTRFPVAYLFDFRPIDNSSRRHLHGAAHLREPTAAKFHSLEGEFWRIGWKRDL